VIVVVVVSPSGASYVVSKVVLEEGRAVWGLGTRGSLSRRPGYSSLDEAVVRNDRATSSAYRTVVADAKEALALLGKPPPPRA